MKSPLTYYSSSLRQKYFLDEVQKTGSKQALKSAAIGWKSDYAIYRARADARLALGGLQLTVPNEIDAELKGINQENFRLPTLGPQLCKYRDEVHFGKGFFVLRGLDPKKYSGEENNVIFLGISKYIGETSGRQDQTGNMIAHILDAAAPGIPIGLIQSNYTNAAQPFHSDVVCDVLALQTLDCAAQGEQSIISSSWAVYNELASTRPDLIHTLAQSDWTFDTFGRDPAYHQRPLLHFHNGKFILNFSRRILTGSPSAPRTPGIPPITEAQAEALDAVHFIASKHQLALNMQPGDLRFINNLGILHCRNAFKNNCTSQRHIVRLWLRNEEQAWDTPPVMKVAWDRVHAEADDMPRIWNFKPTLTRDHIISPKKSCGQG